MNSIVKSIFFAVWTLIVASCIHAESVPAANLQDLIDQLIKVNPEIQAARLRYQAELARIPQEKALPDPRVNFGWMSAGTILPGGKLGEDPNANIGFQVSQEFPYPGKRDLRAIAAEQEAAVRQHMWLAAVRRNVAQLQTSFYELSFIYKSLDLLEENQIALRRLSEVAEARYSVGKGMQQDLIKSQTEVAILQNKMLSLEQRKQALTAEINAVLNRSADAVLGRPESETFADLPSYSTLLEKAKQQSPVLLSQNAMVQSSETGIKLAKKEYYPDFEFMSGYYYQGELDDMFEFRAEISIPVFYRSKQRKQVEQAALELNEARQTQRSAEQTIEYRLKEAYSKAETSAKLMALYEKQIVPQSRLALESSLASYESGNVDFLTVFSNFTTILEYQMSYYEQEAEYFKALAVIQELTGGELSQEVGS